MSISTTDNHAFFPDNDRPVHQPEASFSSWLGVPPHGFTDHMKEKHQRRMSRSREAKSVSGTFIVGHVGRAK